MGDFEALLSMATKTHEKTSSKPNFFKSTQVSAAKKDPKAKKLSDNVKKFLDRRKADEDAKRKEADRQRHELQKMRADSRESQKVVKRMVTKNKGVNFSVIPEAVNEKDTADTLAGRNQCDEDDYGYESTMARNLYEKLMTKYEANPEDPMAKFTKSKSKNSVKDPNSTLARMKEALSKGDEPLPKFTDRNKKKGKGKVEDDFINDGPIIIGESVRRKDNSHDKNDSDKRVQEEKKKKRLPPPASFEELLKMASQAKSSPAINGPEKVPLEKKKEKEPEFRPMTKKQKEEYERQKQSELRKAGKIQAEKLSNTNKSPMKKPVHASMKSAEKKISHNSDTKLNSSSHIQNGSINKSHSSNNYNSSSSKANIKEHSNTKIPNGSVSSKSSFDKRKNENNNGRSSNAPQIASRSTKDKEQQKLSKPGSSGMQKPDFNKIKNVEAREFPGEKRPPKSLSKSKRPRSRSRSRSPVPYKSKKVSGMRIESDSEYDSEMDDFIDDSDAKIDISAEIRNIFGYDRRKFRDEDDFDDRSMETNRFSDIMKEEARSARLGRMEDLEDMRREEEEKRRKLQKKKYRR